MTAKIGEESAPSLVTPQGFMLWKAYLNRREQEDLRDLIRQAVARSPLIQPEMPRSGKRMSVRQTNFGTWGWTSERSGYRYVRHHPVSGAPWPLIPAPLLELWKDLALYPAPPDCCLVNYYAPDARMGLHQDRDEEVLEAPVVSISLGATGLFRLGRETKGGRTYSFRLESGDVMALTGSARHAFHGVDRIVPDSSDLLTGGGRLNLTLRRVKPNPQ